MEPLVASTSKVSKKRRLPVMGDAEAEHLLLAGHRISHLRRIIRVPLSRALLEEAKKIVEGEGSYVFDGEATKDAVPVAEETDKVNAADQVDELAEGAEVIEGIPEITTTPPRRKNRPRAPVTPRTRPLSPNKSPARITKTPSKPLSTKKSPSPSKARQVKSVPHSGTASQSQPTDGRGGVVSVHSSPGKGDSFSIGLNDLIEAAQTLNETDLTDTEGTDTVSELENGGGRDEEAEDVERKRRKVSTEGLMDRFDRDGSINTGGHDDEDSGEDNEHGDYEMDAEYRKPSTSRLSPFYPPTSAVLSPKSPLRHSVTPSSHLDSPNGKSAHLSPLAFLADQATSLLPSPRIPSRRSVSPATVPHASTFFLSPTRTFQPLEPKLSPSNVLATPSGLKSDAEPTSNGKRPRSPYLRWESAEDEALVNAILQNGQRWELVAQAVPSRTYHQCRQRWLRGLKCQFYPLVLRRRITDARFDV